MDTTNAATATDATPADASANALNNSLLLKTIRREAVPRRPIWLMRQAGRYLPEYRATRQQAGSFLSLVKNPDAACEVTLQPIRRFGFDASIVFSDILIIPDAMDVGLEFVEGRGPIIQRPLRDESAVQQLPTPPADAYQYLYNTCQLTRQNLPDDVPLIGFCGAPFTLACYMVDGKGGGDFWHTRTLLHRRPDVLHLLLAKLTQAATDLLIGQIRAGCQVGMIFDSWGGLLTDSDFLVFSLPYIKKIGQAVKDATGAPVIVFARQCALSLPHIADSGCDVAGVDWQTSLATAQKLTAKKVVLQGNLDPAVLLTDPPTVATVTTQVLQAFAKDEPHIFNLGHGIDKRTPIDNVTALVETVKNYRC